MREVLTEVYATMRAGKMRIALAGVAIAWGIFIFIVLISAGRGLINGMHHNFRAFNIGVVTLTPSETSLPYDGQQRGRSIRLYEEDAAAIDQAMGDTVTRAIGVVSYAVQARRGKAYTNTVVDGYAPGYAVAPNTRIVEGRDINELDMQERRKVCVIPRLLRGVLFGNNGEQAVGRQLLIGGIAFQVVGIYEPLLSANATRAIVAPLSTVKAIWRPDGQLSRLYLQTAHLTTSDGNRQFCERVLSILAARKAFSPADKHAVKIDNLYELPVLISNIMAGLSVFVLIVGLATLISGTVGVSNIMLIAVRERTREIGIRRALGAKGRQIVTLVLSEAVAICLVFGYIGMFIGIAVMELVAKAVSMSGNGDVFSNPTVSLPYVLVVSGVMVAAGVAAGYMPAKQAIRIRIVEAINAR